MENRGGCGKNEWKSVRMADGDDGLWPDGLNCCFNSKQQQCKVSKPIKMTNKTKFIYQIK